MGGTVVTAAVTPAGYSPSMKRAGLAVLVVALGVVALELAVGVSQAGILTSVVGAVIIYLLLVMSRRA
jgi:hypothetical protein